MYLRLIRVFLNQQKNKCLLIPLPHTLSKTNSVLSYQRAVEIYIFKIVLLQMQINFPF